MASKTLVIVESPTKAKTISKFLGSNFTVTSSMGHIRDLPKSKMGIEIEKSFKISYQIPVKAKKTVTALKKMASSADEVILATDEDREGEAISWHLAYILKLDPLKTKRIVFHEITKTAIQEALKNPRTIDLNLVDAQQARRALDRIVGYSLSPFLWRKIKMGLSAGRVQSVALRLIVEREEEIKAFIAQEYWSVDASFGAVDTSLPIKASLSHINDKSCKKFFLTNKESSDDLVAILNKRAFYVYSVDQKKVNKFPYPPFTTSTLQQDAARRLGFSAKQTMMVAQQLYEGIDLGPKGRVGLITYMRTDSLNLSASALSAAQNYISKEFGASYGVSKPRVYKTKSKGAQEAHEAIRPTNVDYSPEDIKSFVDDKQYKLYRLIWGRFLATQMAAATYDSKTVKIKDTEEKKYTFTSNGSTLTFEGFLKVYPIKGEDTLLPQILVNESLKTDYIIGNQHFTQPPGRYSESTLVKALEEHEIGRPSTYASIISTIQTRGYVEKNDQKRFAPTEIGVLVNTMLVEHFPQIVDINFTAKSENDFDEIALGKENYLKMLKDFYDPFQHNLKEKEKSVKKYEKVLEGRVCPDSGHPLVEKFGKFGKFYACSNYPECKYTEQTEEEQTFAQQFSDEKCEKCGSPMAVKKGRFGAFLGCSNYPTCKNIKKIEQKTGEKCPECGIGDMVVKKGKRGMPFKACNRYPDCKFIEKRPKKTKKESNSKKS